MDEKILITTEKKRSFAIYFIFFVLCLALALVMETAIWNNWDDDIGTAMGEVSVLTIFFFAIIAIIFSIISKSELTVTNKRAYGKAAFGKRVDLPLDSISTVATGVFNRLTIATNSGRITFWGIGNLHEFHKTLSNLLIERQNQPTKSIEIKQEIPQSNADELKKYKALLDSGVITQEEFDAKKKQLLGL